MQNTLCAPSTPAGSRMARGFLNGQNLGKLTSTLPMELDPWNRALAVVSEECNRESNARVASQSTFEELIEARATMNALRASYS